MSAPAYLDEHRPASPQYREPRREVISGCLGVHTFEALADMIGIDTGIENGAGFLTNRVDAGSYHRGGDSDSAIRLVREECEAFQIAADGHNRHALSYSFVARTTDLHPESVWTLLAFAVAGREIAAEWRTTGFCPTCSARWVTAAQVAELRARAQRHDFERCPHGLKRGGLFHHGTVQPNDRSDAFSRHPHRQALEQLLAAAIADPLEEGITVAELNELIVKIDAVTQGKVARDPRDGTIWFLEPAVGGFKHRLPTMEAVTLRCYVAKWIGDQPPVVFDCYSTANPPLDIDVGLGDLTAEEIAKAVNDDAARRMAEG